MKKTTLKNLKGVFIALFLACLVGLCSLAFASKPQQARADAVDSQAIVSNEKVNIGVEWYSSGPRIQTSIVYSKETIDSLVNFDTSNTNRWEVCLFAVLDSSFYDIILPYQNGTSTGALVNYYTEADKYGLVYKTSWDNLNRYSETSGFMSAIPIDSSISNKNIYYFWVINRVISSEIYT